MIGFSPRSQALTLYLMPGFETRDSLLKKLGKYTTSKGCCTSGSSKTWI